MRAERSTPGTAPLSRAGGRVTLRAMRLIPVGAALLAAALLAPVADAQELKIYSSMPLQGAARPQAQAVVNGARLALAEAGGAVAGRPGAARVAQQRPRRRVEPGADREQRGPRGDATARRSATSASSTPVRARSRSRSSTRSASPQVSPSNTAIGLTRGGPGAERGEPGEVLPARPAHLLPPSAQRPRPGRRARRGDARPRLHPRRAAARRPAVRPRREPRRADRRPPARRCVSSPAAASAARGAPPSGAPVAPARTASPTPGSPPTERCRCSARSAARCRARACSAATASPSPASRAGCRAASPRARS